MGHHLLASPRQAVRGLSASPEPWHGAGSEPALEMECSLRRWRCHGAVSCCAPAKPWQLILSLWRQCCCLCSSQENGDHVETGTGTPQAPWTREDVHALGMGPSSGAGSLWRGLSTTPCPLAGSNTSLSPCSCSWWCRWGWHRLQELAVKLGMF